MAQSSLIQLIITNVSEQLFSGEVTAVNVPGVEGDMTLLAHHEALITLLRPGVITVTLADGIEKLRFDVSGGTLETSNNQITILV